MIDAPDFDDILSAARQIAPYAVRTPLLRHDRLDAAVQGRLFVKAEPLQRTGSFKFRGAFNRISRLTARERASGVAAFSSGNHAQGVAAAARLCGAPAIIVMPADAPAIKVAATRAEGAEVVFYDRLTESREAIAEDLAQRRGAVLVPPFEDRLVMAGQGTVGLEIAEQMEELGLSPDVVVACASGGGLVGGVALALSRRAPEAKVFAAEPAGYDDIALSLAAGRRVAHGATKPTLCDALMSPMPGEMTFSVHRSRLAGAVCATDDEVLDAMAAAFRWLKLVVEPGGAAGLAAVLSGRLDLQGRTCVVVASGGNVDPAVFRLALDRV